MLRALKVKNKNHLNWLSSYLKREKIFYFSLLNFLFIEKNKYQEIISFYNNDICSYKFISSDFGYDNRVLKYILKHNLKNYKFAELFLFLNDNNFNVIIKKNYDFDDSYLNVSIFKYNDLLTIEKIKEDEFVISKNILNILNGVKIMSIEKENKIVDYISKYLSSYGIDLSLYEYILKETGNNIYEINLINIETEKTILITNIVLNNSNNIVEIGQHSGLVL